MRQLAGRGHAHFFSLGLSLVLVLGLVPANARESAPDPAAQLLQTYVQALAQAGIDADASALLVLPLDAETGISISHQVDRAMNPASTIKLVTTYAALHLLGPDYRWQTRVLVRGDIDAGVLNGDLILQGSGDPTLVVERLWLLLGRVRSMGIRDIRGDLILDKRAFAPLTQSTAAFDGAGGRPYNVLPDAMLLNFHAQGIAFMPDPAAGVARLHAIPPLAGLQLPASVPLATGACGNWTSRLGGDFRQPLAPRFSGAFPAACGERIWYQHLLPVDVYAAALLRTLWAQQGGSWQGQLQVLHAGNEEPTDPLAGARLLLSHESPPLATVVRDINKFSNNLMTRQLFLSLALQQGETPATEAAAARLVQRWLGAQGLDTQGLVLENGAGLSRIERISARQLAAVLQHAWHSPLMPELVTSLPLLGVDGTLRRRQDLGSGHLKTGQLQGVRALAGYVHAASGQRYLVISLINHANAAAGERAQDALLAGLYQRG